MRSDCDLSRNVQYNLNVLIGMHFFFKTVNVETEGHVHRQGKPFYQFNREFTEYLTVGTNPHTHVHTRWTLSVLTDVAIWEKGGV